MTRPWLAVIATCTLASAAGCRAKTRCEDLVREPIAGKYRGGGALGEERMFDVSLEATAQQVALTYTSADGSRIRALYRITKKSKKP
jgi:hypothetical protein